MPLSKKDDQGTPGAGRSDTAGRNGDRRRRRCREGRNQGRTFATAAGAQGSRPAGTREQEVGLYEGDPTSDKAKKHAAKFEAAKMEQRLGTTDEL